MSEADYMNDCDLSTAYTEEGDEQLFEVVNHRNRTQFVGSRGACWSYRRHYGGFVREHADEATS